MNGDTHIIGPKVGTSALSFAEVGDLTYLSLADSADWNFGSGDCTLECWINHNSWSSRPQELFGQFDNNDNQMLVYIYENTLYWQIVNAATNVTPGLAASTATVSNKVWNHVAFVKNGTTITIYVNGVVIISSPGLIPIANKDIKRASVPEEQLIQYLEPT